MYIDMNIIFLKLNIFIAVSTWPTHIIESYENRDEKAVVFLFLTDLTFEIKKNLSFSWLLLNDNIKELGAKLLVLVYFD